MRLAPSRLIESIQRRIADGFYADKAILLVPVGTGTYDDYNNEVMATTNVPIDCSFTSTFTVRDLELSEGYADVEHVDYELRYAGVTPQKGWKVKLVSRYDGTPVKDEREFEIVFIRNRNILGFVLFLRATTV